MRVAAGTYNENIVINRAMTLQGAQVSVDARGRAAAESVVSSSATRTIDLQSTTGPIVIDGFSFSGGMASRVLESTAGNLNGLRIRNNRFTSHVGFAIFLNHAGTDVTIERNELDGSSSTGGGAAIHLDTDNFGGFVLLNNNIANYATRTGFFVDGNHNVGESGTRAPSLNGNQFTSNSVGVNLGTRSFGTLNAPTLGAFGGSIVNNLFNNNANDGLQGGFQHVLVEGNTFGGNGRFGVLLTSFGNTGTDRGAQNSLIRSNTIAGNGFTASGAGISLSSTQAAGTIATNPITFNRIVGNRAGLSYTGTEAIVAENNWWGCNAGPTPAGGVGCGDSVAGANTDANPWTVMCVTASTNPLPTVGGGTSLVTASLTGNSAGVVPSAVVFIPPTSIAFSATQGSISPSSVVLALGVASSTFTPSTGVAGTACATLDAETACVSAGGDECGGATPINAGSTTAFSTFCASNSAPAFSCSASGAKDVWFSFTAPGAGVATVDTCVGASFDTVVEVHSSCGGGGATVGCNDNSAASGCTSGSGLSSVSWFATSGTTYFVRVGGIAGASGTGTLTLAFSLGSCPFPAPLAGCPTPSFVFQESPTTGVCASISSEPVPGAVVSISGWTVIPPNPSTSAALAPFIGDYNVNSYAEDENDVVQIMELTCRSGCTADKILISPVGACSFDASFVDPFVRKRQSSLNGVGFFLASASAIADPHLRGANGVAFDFSGKANATYALFTSQQFVINMHLAAGGPKRRFIVQLGIVFHNVTIAITPLTFRHRNAFVTDIDKQLRQVGGRATVPRPFVVELELCAGHTVVVSRARTSRPHLAHDDGSSFAYLNVEIAAPGCHNSYDGALGQTFKCRHAHEKFVFDRTTEESFRVDSLFAVSGAFQTDAPCHDREPLTPMIGSLVSSVEKKEI